MAADTSNITLPSTDKLNRGHPHLQTVVAPDHSYNTPASERRAQSFAMTRWLVCNETPTAPVEMAHSVSYQNSNTAQVPMSGQAPGPTWKVNKGASDTTKVTPTASFSPSRRRAIPSLSSVVGNGDGTFFFNTLPANGKPSGAQGNASSVAGSRPNLMMHRPDRTANIMTPLMTPAGQRQFSVGAGPHDFVNVMSLTAAPRYESYQGNRDIDPGVVRMSSFPYGSFRRKVHRAEVPITKAASPVPQEPSESLERPAKKGGPLELRYATRVPR